MKKSAITLALLLPFITSFAQANKPEANSFGIQYGVFYTTAATATQALTFSGWLKNGLEVRGGLGFTITGTNSQSDGNQQLGYDYNYERSINKSGSAAISPVIGLVKHIPLKSNLDFFVGGQVSAGVTVPTRTTYSSTLYTGDNYYSFNSTETKLPVSISLGAGIIAGSNFFFYKNLAVGADASLGFSMTSSSGTKSITQIAQNSGSNNDNHTNETMTTATHYNNLTYSASLSGYAGIHLTYYVRTIKSKKAAEKI